MEADSELVAIYQDYYIGSIGTVAISALIAYEWAITLRQEVELVWKAPLTGATILFALNRYIPPINYAIGLVYAPAGSLLVGRWSAAPWKKLLITCAIPFSCKVIAFLQYSLELSGYLPWAVFSAMRAYALSGRCWYAMMSVLILSCVPIILNLVQVYWFNALIDPVYGCFMSSKMSESLQTTFIIVSRLSLIIADGIVIITTWLTMYNTVRLSDRLQAVPSFSRLFLVNGTIYFIILLVLNVLDFILAILQIVDQEENGNYVVGFVDVITSILVSRFLLDLQAVKRRTQHQSSLNSTSSGSVTFERIMGSIDSELQPGDQQILSGGHAEDMVEEDLLGGNREGAVDPVVNIESSRPEESDASAC